MGRMYEFFSQQRGTRCMGGKLNLIKSNSISIALHYFPLLLTHRLSLNALYISYDMGRDYDEFIGKF